MARYNGRANGSDTTLAMAVDSSGDVYVTGYSTGSGTALDYATVKYSPSITSLGLTTLLETLVVDGVVDSTMENSLVSKIENAASSSTKDNICTAVNQLEAFKNQIEAQRGNKISNETADSLIAYADNLITSLLNQLPEGEIC